MYVFLAVLVVEKVGNRNPYSPAGLKKWWADATTPH